MVGFAGIKVLPGGVGCRKGKGQTHRLAMKTSNPVWLSSIQLHSLQNLQ